MNSSGCTTKCNTNAVVCRFIASHMVVVVLVVPVVLLGRVKANVVELAASIVERSPPSLLEDEVVLVVDVLVVDVVEAVVVAV